MKIGPGDGKMNLAKMQIRCDTISEREWIENGKRIKRSRGVSWGKIEI